MQEVEFDWQAIIQGSIKITAPSEETAAVMLKNLIGAGLSISAGLHNQAGMHIETKINPKSTNILALPKNNGKVG
jgi:hypothetical protein|tara:strand:- start:2193 stop:2417 length:225 start_codon:yes stop_codon:yes gene_type:complete